MTFPFGWNVAQLTVVVLVILCRVLDDEILDGPQLLVHHVELILARPLSLAAIVLVLVIILICIE